MTGPRVGADDFVVGPDHAGGRLDRVVADVLGATRSAVTRAIADGRVTVDGRVVAKSHRCTPDEHVRVAQREEEPVPDAPVAPPVRWQDEHLMVVAKPPGIVVHPGVGHDGDTLVDALQAAGLAPEGGDPARPGIVHRLDRDTSGLLVVARSEAAHAGLVAQFRDRRVRRHYVALTVGTPPATRGRVDAPIGRHPRHRQRFAVVAEGRHAVTHWVVLGVGDDVALVGCRLETGRTHQIRVHLAHLDSPVVGDGTYGRRSGAMAAALGIARPALHAASLGFVHPVTGARIDLVEPLPGDLLGAAAASGMDAADVVDAVAEFTAPSPLDAA